MRNLGHFFLQINRLNAPNINNLDIFWFKWANYWSVKSFRDKLRIKCTLYSHLYYKAHCFQRNLPHCIEKFHLCWRWSQQIQVFIYTRNDLKTTFFNVVDIFFSTSPGHFSTCYSMSSSSFFCMHKLDAAWVFNSGQGDIGLAMGEEVSPKVEA